MNLHFYDISLHKLKQKLGEENAKAMMGKVVDDEFRIALPSGVKNYEVTAISYTPIFVELKKVIRTEKEFSFK